MKLAILKERIKGESRVAISPEMVKKLVSSGVTIHIEQGAGEASFVSNEEYIQAGAKVSISGLNNSYFIINSHY